VQNHAGRAHCATVEKDQLYHKGRLMLMRPPAISIEQCQPLLTPLWEKDILIITMLKRTGMKYWNAGSRPGIQAAGCSLKPYFCLSRLNAMFDKLQFVANVRKPTLTSLLLPLRSSWSANS
jgi:hypothetical protein